MQININLDAIKREFEQNPVGTLAVGAVAVTAVSKLLDSVSAAQGRRAYARQIDHKIKAESRKN